MKLLLTNRQILDVPGGVSIYRDAHPTDSQAPEYVISMAVGTERGWFGRVKTKYKECLRINAADVVAWWPDDAAVVINTNAEA